MGKREGKLKPPRMLFLLIAAIFANDLLLLWTVSMHDRPRTVWLGSAAPLVIIASTIYYRKLTANFDVDDTLRDWRLASPLVVFGFNEQFLLLPIHKNSGSFLGANFNPHGILLVTSWIMFAVGMCAFIVLFWAAAYLPFVYHDLLQDSWAFMTYGWCSILTTFISALCACFFWSTLVMTT